MSRRAARRRRPPLAPRLELLEPRQLLTGTVSVQAAQHDVPGTVCPEWH